MSRHSSQYSLANSSVRFVLAKMAAFPLIEAVNLKANITSEHDSHSHVHCQGEKICVSNFVMECVTEVRLVFQPTEDYPFNFVARETWGARPPNGVTNLNLPVPYVIVHHSYIPPDCETKDACKRNMRLMQDMHQLHNGWQDIGYNFAVGGEGSVYEGRGWDTVGAHAVSYNVKSIGICMIGDFVDNLPPATQIQTLKELIAAGVAQGYISPDYKLIGHRQASATECPGQALFDEISTWDHFTPSA